MWNPSLHGQSLNRLYYRGLSLGWIGFSLAKSLLCLEPSRKLHLKIYFLCILESLCYRLTLHHWSFHQWLQVSDFSWLKSFGSTMISLCFTPYLRPHSFSPCQRLSATHSLWEAFAKVHWWATWKLEGMMHSQGWHLMLSITTFLRSVYFKVTQVV